MPGGLTSFLHYCAIAVVAGASVAAGLDFMPATMSPMPEVNVTAYAPPPPPPKIATPAPIPRTVRNPLSAPLLTPAPSVAARPVTPPPAAEPAPAPMPAPAPVAQTPPPLCDVAACAAAYRSFRESDCTYNPNYGPRRLCTKGVPPSEAGAATDVDVQVIANPEPDEAGQADKPASPLCNVAACANAYFTFTPSDCTYQPSDGPRRLCTK